MTHGVVTGAGGGGCRGDDGGGGSLCLLNAPQFSKYFFPNVICVFTWKTIFLCIFKYFTFSRHTFELTSWSEVCFVFKYFSHKYLKVVSEWTPVQKYLHRVFWPSREHRTRLRFCSRWLQSELDLDERESFLLLWLEIRFINQYPVFFFLPLLWPGDKRLGFVIRGSQVQILSWCCVVCVIPSQFVQGLNPTLDKRWRLCNNKDTNTEVWPRHWRQSRL